MGEMDHSPNMFLFARRCGAAQTGVEMEAMTAASVAALTVYDMCKAVSKGIVIREVRLIRKSGGKSGLWEAQDGGVRTKDAP
tara:strand:- start:1504 stop:1749 length:246 start_codon:yes stop_codon:yes gene_type:complete